MKTIVSPSLLSSDFSRLADEALWLNESRAQWFHLDVMDGVFVPNISFGLPVVSAIRKLTTKVLDVHLMIENPDAYIGAFRDAGADVLTVHFEACSHLHRTLGAITQAGMKAGVAINPHTPVAALSEVASMADLVLVMSVNPGFGGQAFIPNAVNKVKQAAELRQKSGANFKIEVDGGVDALNAPALVAAGADVLVAGSSIFKAADRKGYIEKLGGL